MALVALTVLMAACGGGGGGGAASAASTPPPVSGSPPAPAPSPAPSPGPFVDTLPPQTAPINAYRDVERFAAFEVLSAIRVAAGLGVLYQSTALDVAAQGHADYASLNDAIGNIQVPGNPGFTGVYPQDRIAAAGYSASYGTELHLWSTQDTPAVILLDGLMGAPYRRMALLRFMTSDVGLGYSAEFPTSLVVEIAHSATNPQGAPSLDAVWPADGATQVIRSSCCESPDPLPELAGRPWGFPVSVHTHERKVLVVNSFTLVDAAGQSVASKVLSYATDPYLQARDERQAALLMPLAPLAPNTRFDAAFIGTIDGAPFIGSWSFTTGDN